jgi:hypothetical protein
MTIVRDNQKTLLSIYQIQVGYVSARNEHNTFDIGPARREIREMFKIDGTYEFLRVHANPKTQKNIRCPKDSDSVDPFSDVIKLYQTILSELVDKARLTCRSYPLVEVQGVHSLDWGRKRYFYPNIWVFSKGKEVSAFRSLVDGLQQEEAYVLACAKEAPHNYHRKEIDYLHKRGILPLTIDDRIWTVSGRDLKDAIDFLCTFHYERTHTR